MFLEKRSKVSIYLFDVNILCFGVKMKFLIIYIHCKFGATKK